MFKKAAILTAILSLSGIVIGIAAVMFLAGSCENEQISSIQTPNQKSNAIVFWRNCGATTGFNTQISLLSGDSRLNNEAGNIFVADTDHGKAPSAKHGGPSVKLNWVTNELLRISTHEDTRIFKQVSKLNGVSVEYQTYK